MGVYRQDKPLKFCLLILGQRQKLAHLFWEKKGILLLAFSSNVCEANGMGRVPSSNELPFATLKPRMFQELAQTGFGKKFRKSSLINGGIKK